MIRRTASVKLLIRILLYHHAGLQTSFDDATQGTQRGPRVICMPADHAKGGAAFQRLGALCRAVGLVKCAVVRLSGDLAQRPLIIGR